MSQIAIPSDLNGYGEPFAMTPPAPGFGLRALGCVATAAAVVGVVLPLWPTTPFALLAAWAFARSSPGLEAGLLRHRRLGPAITAWRARGAIPRQAKVLTVASLPASWTGLWLAHAGTGVLVGTGVILAGVGLWVLSRPA